MSAKSTSSRARSERNPEGEEDGEEGEEEASITPAGASSGLAPADLQSLGGPVAGGGGEGAFSWEDWVSGVGAEEVVAVVQLAAAVLVMAVGGPTSMSLRAEEKLLKEAGGGGARGSRSVSGNRGA